MGLIPAAPTSFVTGNKGLKKRLLSLIVGATNLLSLAGMTINRRGFIYCLALEISQQLSTPACPNDGGHLVFVHGSVGFVCLCQTVSLEEPWLWQRDLTEIWLAQRKHMKNGARPG